MAQTFDGIVKSFNQLVSSEYQWAVKERKDIYYDRWEYIMRNALDEIFTTDVYDGLKCLVTGEFNLFKTAINATSTIYSENAERKLVLGETEEEISVDPVYDEVVKKVPFDLIMKTTNRLTNATNASAIRTVWREGKLDYDIINFDSLQILTDPSDWKKIIGYCFYIGATQPYFQEGVNPTNDQVKALPHRTHPGEQSPYTQYETGILYTADDDYFNSQYRGKIIYFNQRKGGSAVISTNGDGKPKIEDNPYRDREGNVVLPFTLITKDYPVDYLIDYSTGNDLVWATINTAIRYVHMNNLITNQSWKQPYVISDVDLPGEWNLDPRSTLRIPASKNGGTTSIGLLDLQSNLKTQWEVIIDMATVALAQYGIPSDNVLRKGGNPESGFALEVKREGLKEIRKQQLPLYEAAEKDLFEKTRIIYNHHAKLERKPLISEDGEFRIDFADPAKSSNQTEEDMHWQTLINNNVKSMLDWIKSENPDIKTDEDAKEVLRNNKIINNRLATVLSPVNQPDEQVEDESEGL